MNAGEPHETPAGPSAPAPAETVDDFLGGRVRMIQPARGYRAGLDAVLLAAAAPAGRDHAPRVLDVGAGAGAVGICLAARVPDARITFIERDPAMADLAARNIAANGLAGRAAVVAADVTDRKAIAALPRELPDGGFDLTLANPPYHASGTGTPAERPQKADAHAMPAADLAAWLRFLARMTRPGGTATIVHRADALPLALDAFGRRFGAIAVLPVYSRPGEPASRIIVTGTKGSRAPFRLLSGIVLHGAEGHRFTPEADAILRHGALLPMG